MSSEASLIERIRKIEALFEGAASAGEEAAARAARERLNAKLDAVQRQKPEDEEEFTFSLSDPWARKVFLALLRRHGIRPYRYPRQKRQTVMARMQQTYLDQTLWPEFEQIHQLLHEHLRSVADRVIRECIHGENEEAQVVRGLEAP